MIVLDGVIAAGTAGYALDVPVAVLAALPTLVILGVLDGILGEEETQENADTEEATDGGTMFDDDGDDLGFDDEGGDDAFGDGDAFGGGDDFGGGADAFDDFGGADGMDDGASVSDLEHRVDQLEQELSSLSSTVSTVKTENEQISESVDGIEENIRKLLDIYKMVTKGVNPFVDQQGAGGDFAAAVDDNTLGLFEDEEAEEQEDVDDDVMDADAEDFFDDDFGDGEEEFDDEEFEVEEFDEEEEFDDGEEEFVEEEFDDGEEEFVEEEFDDGEEEFVEEPEGEELDELEAEYEEDGDWEEEPIEDPVDEPHEPVDDAPQEAFDEPVDGHDDPRDGEQRVDALLDEAEQPIDQEPAHEDELAHEQPVAEQPAHEQPVAEQPSTDQQPAHAGAGKPYLVELPPGYVEDFVVLEWIEFLVEESSPEQAYSAITYYERVDWIGADAADQLRTFLAGHPNAEAPLSGAGGPSSLSTDHHTQSLRYVARLNGNASQGLLEL